MSAGSPTLPDAPNTAAELDPIARGARSSAVFVALSVFQRAVPLLLLPVFTAVLTPDEYGRISVLLAISGVLGAVLGLGLEPAVLRTYIQLATDPRERERFVATLGLFTIAAPLGGAIIAAVGVMWAKPDFADGLVILLAFGATAMQTTSVVFVAAILRAQVRLKAYAVVSLLLSVGGPLLAVMLVVVLRLGVFGWFAASLATSAAALIVGLIVVEEVWTRTFSMRHLLSALRFGLPLLPHSLSHWALNLSDRLVLAAFVATATVGVYNVAYQLAAPIGMILIAVRQGLMPMYASAAGSARLRHDLGDLATLQVHLAGVLGLGSALIGPALIWQLFPPSYASATGFIPWIALGYVFFGLYLLPVDSLSLMIGRTTWLWVPTALAAVANIALNVLLIPRFGALAAAVDTAVAYGILYAGVVFLRRSTAGHRIRFDVRRMAVGLLIVGIAFAAGQVFTPDVSSVGALVARIGIVGLTGAIILAFDVSWWPHRTEGSQSVPELTSG